MLEYRRRLRGFEKGLIVEVLSADDYFAKMPGSLL